MSQHSDNELMKSSQATKSNNVEHTNSDFAISHDDSQHVSTVGLVTPNISVQYLRDLVNRNPYNMSPRKKIVLTKTKLRSR